MYPVVMISTHIISVQLQCVCCFCISGVPLFIIIILGSFFGFALIAMVFACSIAIIRECLKDGTILNTIGKNFYSRRSSSFTTQQTSRSSVATAAVRMDHETSFTTSIAPYPDPSPVLAHYPRHQPQTRNDRTEQPPTYDDSMSYQT